MRIMTNAPRTMTMLVPNMRLVPTHLRAMNANAFRDGAGTEWSAKTFPNAQTTLARRTKSAPNMMAGIVAQCANRDSSAGARVPAMTSIASTFPSAKPDLTRMTGPSVREQIKFASKRKAPSAARARQV